MLDGMADRKLSIKTLTALDAQQSQSLLSQYAGEDDTGSFSTGHGNG